MLVIGGAAVVVVLLLVPALMRLLLRRRRHAATPGPAPAVVRSVAPDGGGVSDLTVTTDAVRARHDAHAAWDELVDTMIDYRVPVDPTETPRHTAQRLVRVAALTDDPAHSATLLGTAEERARYARTPMQGGELTRALVQVRKGLAGTATRRTRLAATLLPPSVVLRWRLGVADSSVRVMGMFSRSREVLMRFSPRRLLPARSR